MLKQKALRFLFAFSWIFLSGFTNSVTTYYNPVLSPDGQKIAYLKRDTLYRYDSVFWGAVLHFSRDILYLCVSSRSGRKENCLKQWSLPLKKLTTSVKGSVNGRVGWEKSNLLYHIELTGWPTEDQNPGKGGIALKKIITNLNPGQTIPVQAKNERWKVYVNPQPEKFAYPVNNRILVEKIK